MCTCVRKCYIFVPQPQTAPDVTASVVDFTLLSHGFTIDGIFFSLWLTLSILTYTLHTPRVLYRFHVKITRTVPGVWIWIYLFYFRNVDKATLFNMLKKSRKKRRAHLSKQGKKMRCKCLSKSAKRTIKSTNLRHLLKQIPLHQHNLFSFLFLLPLHLCSCFIVFPHFRFISINTISCCFLTDSIKMPNQFYLYATWKCHNVCINWNYVLPTQHSWHRTVKIMELKLGRA